MRFGGEWATLRSRTRPRPNRAATVKLRWRPIAVFSDEMSLHVPPNGVPAPQSCAARGPTSRDVCTGGQWRRCCPGNQQSDCLQSSLDDAFLLPPVDVSIDLCITTFMGTHRACAAMAIAQGCLGTKLSLAI